MGGADIGSWAGSLGLVQTIYDLESNDGEWQKQIAESAYHWLGGREGALAYPYRLDGEKVAITGPVHVIDGPSEWAAMPQMFMDAQSARDKRRTHTIEFAPASEFFAPAFWETIAPAGFLDGYALQGLESPDRATDGLHIFIATRQHLDIEGGMRQRGQMVSAHIAAGMRLRANLCNEDLLSKATAIFEADGKVAHRDASFDVLESDFEELRREISATHRMQPRSESDAREALLAWTALVTGRWSLLDHVDSDGRHYMVAVENAPELADPRRLDARERAIVSYAAMGCANKSIAYHLGLHESTISRAMSSALAKLGLRDRLELAQVLGPLAQAAHTEQS